ncbi:hypothetical protein COO60DRAFT_1240908 [Scenedesmus sp. NREL 46B-D3]|nr:hypothetical protein COO60DRAFT_1240908 [Scenedesmus sp. NREL 46B-D3]
MSGVLMWTMRWAAAEEHAACCRPARVRLLFNVVTGLPCLQHPHPPRMHGGAGRALHARGTAKRMMLGCKSHSECLSQHTWMRACTRGVFSPHTCQRCGCACGPTCTLLRHATPCLHHPPRPVALQTLMMIDNAISAQMRGGGGNVSADLQAYLAGSHGRPQN